MSAKCSRISITPVFAEDSRRIGYDWAVIHGTRRVYGYAAQSREDAKDAAFKVLGECWAQENTALMCPTCGRDCDHDVAGLRAL